LNHATHLRTTLVVPLLVALMEVNGVAAETVDEYQAKAAILYNFAKFVQWPPQAFHNSTHPITICIFGRTRIERELADAARGKDIGSRPVVVSAISKVPEACNCQMLFISSSEQKRIKSILQELRTMSVLTVGETDGFTDAGGIANLEFTRDRIQMSINVEAAAAARLQISSKLLRLARIVKAGPQNSP